MPKSPTFTALQEGTQETTKPAQSISFTPQSISQEPKGIPNQTNYSQTYFRSFELDRKLTNESHLGSPGIPGARPTVGCTQSVPAEPPLIRTWGRSEVGGAEGPLSFVHWYHEHGRSHCQPVGGGINTILTHSTSDKWFTYIKGRVWSIACRGAMGYGIVEIGIAVS